MSTEQPFRPAAGLRNPHLQTLWPVAFAPDPPRSLERERLELPDGDFLDLDHLAGPVRRPRVLIVHGLEGSVRSHYASSLLTALKADGYAACFMHFRGCSGEPNRLGRSYHAGETGDIAHVVAHLQVRYPGQPIVAIAYSLGGNALLKWLGETGSENPLAGAAAVSVPYRLEECARRIDSGLSRGYQRHLLARMKASVRRKQARYGLLRELGDLRDIRSFIDFDDRITAPLHGFAGVDDYYARASARGYLKGIERPSLLLHARDDPFMYPQTVPEAAELSATTELELSTRGGHVGFVDRAALRGGRGWLARRLLRWVERLAARG